MSDRGVQNGPRDETAADLEVRNATLKRASEILSPSAQTITDQIGDLLAVVRDVIGTAGATFSHVDGDTYRLEEDRRSSSPTDDARLTRDTVLGG